MSKWLTQFIRAPSQRKATNAARSPMLQNISRLLPVSYFPGRLYAGIVGADTTGSQPYRMDVVTHLRYWVQSVCPFSCGIFCSLSILHVWPSIPTSNLHYIRYFYHSIQSWILDESLILGSTSFLLLERLVADKNGFDGKGHAEQVVSDTRACTGTRGTRMHCGHWFQQARRMEAQSRYMAHYPLPGFNIACRISRQFYPRTRSASEFSSNIRALVINKHRPLVEVFMARPTRPSGQGHPTSSLVPSSNPSSCRSLMPSVGVNCSSCHWFCLQSARQYAA